MASTWLASSLAPCFASWLAACFASWLVAWGLLGQIEMPKVSGPTDRLAGSIHGVVVNACQENQPVAGAEVVLRVLLDGQFVVAAETIADDQGRFVFDPIPADADYVYVPGANYQGVHYPSPRIRLATDLPHANVKLAVHETVAEPNPLVVRSHEIAIRSDSEAIHVTETLAIDNPTQKTYVGRPKQKGGRATTLRLSIPSQFRRATFDREFYGRQFTVIDGNLVTDIPWTPGRRELKLSYVLPVDGSSRSWQRPLDLPCESLRIDVHTQKPDEVSCNLDGRWTASAQVASFESNGQRLQPNQVVAVQLERVPFALSTYGRWLALGFLSLLIAATLLVRYWSNNRRPPRSSVTEPSRVAPSRERRRAA